MKKIIGIVSEYNPFHQGHKYHIEQSRNQSGDAVIICVMSGDFVQRGEWAILPKQERAVAAVKGGADLVIELPLPWCLSSAEQFAEGAVSILLRMGITVLSFGSEYGNIEAMRDISEIISGSSFHTKVKEYMHRNPETTYPEARAQMVRELGYDSLILDGPNNSLGVEYLKALKKENYVNCFGQSVLPITVKRYGSGHDKILSEHTIFPSAMEVRKQMLQKGEGIDSKAMELAAVSRLRMISLDEILSLTDSANGAGQRLFRGIRTGGMTIDEVCTAAKTRSLTYSRLRRLAMKAVLGVTEDLMEGRPPYARVLAMNEHGRDYLSEIKKSDVGEMIPILTQPKQVAKISEYAEKVFAAGAYARDLYNMGFAEKKYEPCGEDYRMGPFFQQNCES